MYDYNNTEAQTISTLITFTLLRNKIKNVSFLGELYDFNNIDIGSLYNIVSTSTKSLKSLKNYVKNIILDNNGNVKKSTLKFISNNIVFFNATVYQDVEKMPTEIFLNLENINIMLTTVIANINTSL